MSDPHCLVVGASHAGVSLALALRKEGWSGDITLIGAEQELPYHRPPLSKEYLAGHKPLSAIGLRPSKLYRDNAITLISGTRATAIDRRARTVALDTGKTLTYDRLALCTGAVVKKLPLGQNLDRVHYLRTVADADRIRRQLPGARQVVIVGAGYIGLEAAAVLRTSGLQVTVLEMAERVLSRVTGRILSDFVSSLHRAQGVTVRTAERVTALRPVAARQQILVECLSGDAMYADLVLVGVGVMPNTDLAESAGLEVDDGIVVDCHARSSDPDIFAAGDCTRHPNSLYGRSLRLESVQNANDQARAAAATICGKETVYRTVPWFWSDQYELKLQMAGLSEGHDQTIVRGDPWDREAGFAVFYFRAGRLIAADCVRRPREFLTSKRLIAENPSVDIGLLQDEGSDPASWL